MSDFDKAAYWFDGADYDLQTAQAMLETRRLLYVGFMCHQTIEKALKGVFIEASCMIVETHPGCQAPACSAYRF